MYAIYKGLVSKYKNKEKEKGKDKKRKKQEEEEKKRRAGDGFVVERLVRVSKTLGSISSITHMKVLFYFYFRSNLQNIHDNHN